MRLEDLHIGTKVSFRKIKNGVCCGVENEVLTIIEINTSDWGACNCKLSNGTYTNNNSIELVEDKAPVKKQLTIFDFM